MAFQFKGRSWGEVISLCLPLWKTRVGFARVLVLTYTTPSPENTKKELRCCVGINNRDSHFRSLRRAGLTEAPWDNEYHRRTRMGPVPVKMGSCPVVREGLPVRVNTARQLLEEEWEHQSDVVQERQEFQAVGVEEETRGHLG